MNKELIKTTLPTFEEIERQNDTSQSTGYFTKSRLNDRCYVTVRVENEELSFAEQDCANSSIHFTICTVDEHDSFDVQTVICGYWKEAYDATVQQIMEKCANSVCSK